MENKNTKFNFAKAMEELEKINRWFESEEVDLEEGIKKFDEGMKLIEFCKERLKQVENKIIKIKKQ
ncbi:MAG: exodeoxyribonuclease VII small subunit [Patescibacteria group bacterium]